MEAYKEDKEAMPLPKAQPFPANKIKPGAVLFVASAYTDDNGKTSSELQEWVVRSIRAKRGSKSRFGHAALGTGEIDQYVNLTLKLGYVSWGKLSPKVGDYGWLKSIPAWCTKQFVVGSDLPSGVYTTPRAALIFEIAETDAAIVRNKRYLADEQVSSEIAAWERDIADLEAQMRALKARLSRINK